VRSLPGCGRGAGEGLATDEDAHHVGLSASVDPRGDEGIEQGTRSRGGLCVGNRAVGGGDGINDGA